MNTEMATASPSMAAGKGRFWNKVKENSRDNLG
jgi:hypothetical protein